MRKGFSFCTPEAELLASGIVKGDIVQKGDADDKSAVMLLGANSLCTAAPIGQDVLLTAAHCVGDDASVMQAAFYPSMSCESGFNITKYSIGVSRVVKHPGYDTSLPVEKRVNDIALVFLKSKIPDGYPIYRIADPNYLTDLNQMFLYGFGIVGENQGGRGILRKAVIESRRYSINFPDSKIEVNQMNNSGFCMGDSGGPAFVKINDEMQILGVNSYVSGHEGNICNGFGFQTLVKPYSDWIYSQ
ncbi:MAG: S1 family peptidase [Pseudobdellovibrio sp.]